MHELAFIERVIKAADEAAARLGIKKVDVIRLKLGQMIAAHPEQLDIGVEIYGKGTRLEGAKIEVEDVKVELECDKCRANFFDPRFDDHVFAHSIAHTPQAYVPPQCPKCSSQSSKVVRGDEVIISGLDEK